MKVPVSVLIPVRNEERNIARAIGSVEWADQIFVVDSHSNDRTVDIASGLGAVVVQFDHEGGWPKKKNWALDNLPFRNEWVFILDADEALPPESEQEFREICSGDENDLDGYFINRRFMFMGKWLKHAYYPNWNLRLFRHKMGRYEKLSDEDTHSGDVEIHEHVLLKGRKGRLRSEMDHYAFPTVEEFVKKHNRYSNWEACISAGGCLDNSRTCALGKGDIGKRRALKSLAQKLPFRPLLRFIYVYFVQMGFLDGREGYYFAKLHAFYEFLCVCKTYELRIMNRERSDA